MRIFHVINHTGRMNGNVHAAVDLACAQARLGHAVKVCHSGGDFDQELDINGVETDILRMDRTPTSLARTVMALGRSMKRWRADVVHAHMVASALLSYPGCRWTGRPLITTGHDIYNSGTSLMRVGDRVIAVSSSVADWMAKRGISDDCLRTIRSGTIGSARFTAAKPKAKALQGPSVLFMGGLHPHKGVPDLLDAFDRVHRTRPRAKLYLLGEGPHEMHYRAMAAGLPSGAAITFCGAQNDPRPYLLGADIFVLPSIADSAPLVLSEAREAGCAIIGTAVDGIPELLEHGKAGILVPPGAPAKLARAIEMLIDDADALTHWRACSQYEIDRLSIARVAQDTLDVYSECLMDQTNDPCHYDQTCSYYIPQASPHFTGVQSASGLRLIVA